MIALIAVLGLLTQQASPIEPAWTWTLYSDAGPVVLANEVPDTPNLRATLECEPGSSIALVTLYGGENLSGMARVSAGEASAVAQAEAGRAGGLKVAVRTDHPVFAAFSASGRMNVMVGDQRRSVEVPQSHLAKLRRFAELCSG